MQKLRCAAFILVLAAAAVQSLSSSADARNRNSSRAHPGSAFNAYNAYDPGYDYDSVGHAAGPFAAAPYDSYRRPFAAPFDGSWSAVAQTTRGHCENIQFGLEIAGGRIHSGGGAYGGHSAELGGSVSPSGKVRVSAMAGPRVAHGSGRLGQDQGGGTWTGRGPSGVCSGVWSASRSGF